MKCIAAMIWYGCNYSKCCITVTEYIILCYDDGCHLSKYSTNASRKDLTPTSKMISNLTITVDKMHMAGHVDLWCKRHCDPRKFRDLDDVSIMYVWILFAFKQNVSVLDSNFNLILHRLIEVCEQTFPWLSCYGRMTRKMNHHTYMFFIVYLCHLHNQREVHKLQRSNYMA